MSLRDPTARLCALALFAMAAAAQGRTPEPGIALNLQRELGAVARNHPSNQLAPPVSTEATELAKAQVAADALPGTAAASPPRSSFATRLGYAGAAVAGSLLVGQGATWAGGALAILLALMAAGWLLRRVLLGPPMPALGLRTEPAGWGPAPPPQADPVPPLARATPGGSVPRLPPGFDLSAFLREARLSFARLRSAQDLPDLADLREFTTPHMFEALARRIDDQRGADAQAELLGLDAQLVDLTVEHQEALATVRFHGSESGDAGSMVPFTEVWRVRKRLSDPRASWLLDGIQSSP